MSETPEMVERVEERETHRLGSMLRASVREEMAPLLRAAEKWSAMRPPETHHERSWNFDMSAAPKDGTIIEAAARYPDATAGSPRFIGYYEGAWHEFSRNAPARVIPWAWRPRTDWPREPTRMTSTA